MKNKTMGIISLMAVMLFAFATTALAGDFKNTVTSRHRYFLL